ncbi:MAG: acyloxyacyl hydrolase [Thermoanaerobaculales bacterium]
MTRPILPGFVVGGSVAAVTGNERNQVAATLKSAALLSTMFVVCLGAVAAHSQEAPATTPPPDAPPAEAATTATAKEGKAGGDTIWSIWYGHGFNFVLNGSASEIDIASVGIRRAHMWAEKGSGFLRGRPAFAVEIIPMNTFLEDSQTTRSAGFNLLYEHHFAGRGRILPTWRIGAGFLYANREIPEGETRHNFSLLSALGLDILLTSKSSILFEYRLHHVSNANTGPHNPGINAHTVIVGLSFYR